MASCFLLNQFSVEILTASVKVLFTFICVFTLGHKGILSFLLEGSRGAMCFYALGLGLLHISGQKLQTAKALL